MRTEFMKYLSALIIIVLFFSCESGKRKNPYLGGIPSVEKKYHTEFMELVEGVEKSGDIANSLSLMNEFDRIESEWETAINQEVRITDLSKPIPVENEGKLPYLVEDAVVEHVSRSNLVLRFNIEAVDTISNSRGLFMVFEALDKKGRPIANTTSVANNFNQNFLLPGMKWTLTGYWESEAIVNLENLGSIRCSALEDMKK